MGAFFMNKMRKSRYLILLFVVLGSMTYIGASNHIKSDEIARLYKLINLNEITYEQVTVNIKGITENMRMPSSILNERRIEGEKTLAAVQRLGGKENTQYTLSIKNETRNEETTVYNMQIQGLQNLAEVEEIRNATITLFKEWQVDTKEMISFIGTVKGELNEGQREIYKNQLFKALQGKYVNSYQDDYNVTTTAYYGYTPLVDDYTMNFTGKRVNMQIAFTYNEIQNVTQLIIAFPFYNAPY